MAIGGAFLGGPSDGGDIPTGQCLLKFQIITEDRQNLAGTLTISDGTNTYTKIADADGRAEQLVYSGSTYTVTVSVTGYDNSSSQTVIADSGTVKYVRFELLKLASRLNDKIRMGTSDPDDSVGANGDIYLKYEA